VADATFDVSLSAFGVILAEDGASAVAQMLRATRPGGRVALAIWVPEGPVYDAGQLLRAAFPEPDGPPQRWDRPEWVRGLLTERGGHDLAQARGEIVHAADSPASWFAEQEQHHPVWRFARRELDPARWEDLRRESVAVLARGNEDPAVFRATSRYTILTALSPAS